MKMSNSWCLSSCLLLAMLCISPALSLYCWVDPKDTEGRNAPLLLRPDTDEFAYPAPGGSSMRFGFCERLRAVCPQGNINVFSRRLSRSDAELRCLGLGLFDLPGTGYAAPLRRIICDQRPEPSAENTTVACVNGTLARIGFPLQPSGFVSTIPRVCFNDTVSKTNWVESKLLRAAAKALKKRPAPEESASGEGFRTGAFFGNVTGMGPNIFSPDYQRTRLTTLLNSSSLAEMYIPRGGSQYLEVAQLAPAGDMLYPAQRQSARFYLNTLPVWRSIRRGNWRLVEDLLRKEAARQKVDLDLWTGGVDNFTLPNAEGNATAINLADDLQGNSTQIPVPRFLFKVALDRVHNRGLVFVTLNDPSIKAITDAEQLCGKIYDRCTTLYPQFSMVKLGYTHCCTLDEFANTANRIGLPAFPENVKPLF